ncbi:MAG: RAMP superfamily CRISPR-associated protein, partial [Candidatus Asgardarchaeia archaeon]
MFDEEDIIAVFKLKTLTPLVITAKRGAGNFIKTLDIIPASSLIGALCRAIVLTNMDNKRGKCAELKDTVTLPDCDNCSLNDKCLYPKLWRNQFLSNKNNEKIIVSWAYPINKSIESNINNILYAPVIPSLKSLIKPRIRMSDAKEIYDSLIFYGLFEIGRKYGITRFIDILGPKVKNRIPTKPMSATVYYDEKSKRIQEININTTQITHITISDILKTVETGNDGEKGELYHYEAISENNIFYFYIISKKRYIDLLMKHMKDHPIQIGAAKSRGYGFVEIEKVIETTVNKYISERIKKIQEYNSKFGSYITSQRNFSNKLFLTITGLSPLKIDNKTVQEALLFRINQKVEILKFFFTLDTFLRIDISKPQITFNLTPIVNAGYSVFIEITTKEDEKEKENIIRQLLEWEIKIPYKS